MIIALRRYNIGFAKMLQHKSLIIKIDTLRANNMGTVFGFVFRVGISATEIVVFAT